MLQPSMLSSCLFHLCLCNNLPCAGTTTKSSVQPEKCKPRKGKRSQLTWACIVPISVEPLGHAGQQPDSLGQGTACTHFRRAGKAHYNTVCTESEECCKYTCCHKEARGGAEKRSDRGTGLRLHGVRIHTRVLPNTVSCEHICSSRALCRGLMHILHALQRPAFRPT